MNNPQVGEYWRIKLAGHLYVVLVTEKNVPIYTAKMIYTDDKEHKYVYTTWTFNSSYAKYHKISKHEINKILAKLL